MKIDRFMLTDFVEFLIENYEIDSAFQDKICNGTDCDHSFKNRKTNERELINDVSKKFAKEKGLKTVSAFDSEYLNCL